MSTTEKSALPPASSFSESVEAAGVRTVSSTPSRSSRPSSTAVKIPACTALGWKSSARVAGRASLAAFCSSSPHPAEASASSTTTSATGPFADTAQASAGVIAPASSRRELMPSLR